MMSDCALFYLRVRENSASNVVKTFFITRKIRFPAENVKILSPFGSHSFDRSTLATQKVPLDIDRIELNPFFSSSSIYETFQSLSSGFHIKRGKSQSIFSYSRSILRASPTSYCSFSSLSFLFLALICLNQLPNFRRGGRKSRGGFFSEALFTSSFERT